MSEYNPILYDEWEIKDKKLILWLKDGKVDEIDLEDIVWNWLRESKLHKDVN
jgi:hypothetical protein